MPIRAASRTFHLVGQVPDTIASAGVPKDAARQLAISMIAMLEGAFILCRATRSTEAILLAGEWCAKAAEAALACPRV